MRNLTHVLNLVLITSLLSVMALSSCSDSHYVSDDLFVGTWELKGRGIYNKMTVSIAKGEDGLKGKVNSVPDNKYGKLFLEEGQAWISEISRSSDYYFKIKENKIASELFSAYGLSATSTYYITFSEDGSKFYLTDKIPNKTAQETSVYYERIK